MKRTITRWFGWVCIASAPALAVEITLPAETAAYRQSALPGYNLVQQHCLACHSADYVSSQPLDSTREYWEHTVTKMQQAFGGPIPNVDIPPMVDYLAKTYGAERNTATFPSSTGDSQSRLPSQH